MPNAIIINFRVGGVDEISRAFRNVEQATDRFERRVKKGYQEETRVAQEANRAKERDFQKLAREMERVQEKSRREAMKASEQELRAAKKSADDKLREEKRWADQRQRIQQRSAEMAYKIAADEVRAVERAEQQKAAARERFARSVSGRVSTIGGASVRHSLRGMAGMAGSALALGGGFAIADAVSQSFSAERQAAQLVNAVTTTGAPPAGANVNNILKQAGGISASLGMSKSDVISGALAYARSARGGNFEGAMGNMEFFAKMSKATGTSIEDLAGAAGTLQSQNAELGKDPAKMRQLLLSAYAQSKSGSVSIKDAAKQFGTLGSTRGLFQGDEAHTQATLLGLGQIAAAGGSSEEIGTYIKDFSAEMAQKRKHTSKEGSFGGLGVEQLGVKFDKFGRMESPEQAIGALMKASGGDLGKILEVVGKRGLPLFGELQKSYLNAGGGDAGVKAVTEQIHGVTQSTMSEKDLDQQVAQVMSTPAEQFAKAEEKLREKLEEKLTPVIVKLADSLEKHEPDIEKFLDGLADVADFAMSHPFAAIGGIILAGVTKDLAAAAIGEGVKVSLEKAITLAGGKGLSVSGALGLTALGAVAIAAEQAWINQSIADDHAKQVASAQLLPAGATMVNKLNADPSKGNVADAKALVAQMTAAEATIGQKSSFGQIAGWFQSKEDDKKEEAENKRKLRELMDSVDKLNAAIKRAAETANASTGPNAPARNQPQSSPSRGGTQ